MEGSLPSRNNEMSCFAQLLGKSRRAQAIASRTFVHKTSKNLQPGGITPVAQTQELLQIEF
jgi:hypothetical protein